MRSFKLEQQAEGDNTVVVLEGELIGEYVDLAKSYLEQFLSAPSRLVLKLRDVNSIGPPGLELLQMLADRGVVIVGAGIYTEYVVEKIASRINPH